MHTGNAKNLFRARALVNVAKKSTAPPLKQLYPRGAITAMIWLVAATSFVVLVITKPDFSKKLLSSTVSGLNR